MTHRSYQQGFSLLLAIITASVALSVGLALLSITVKQSQLTGVVRDSEIAFQAASGMMECVQNIRYDNAAAVRQGGAVTDNCLGQSVSITPTGSAGRYTYSTAFDWSTSAGQRCVETDMYIVNEVASDRSILLPERGIDRDCPDDSVCTVILSRGYSVTCADAGNPNSFSFQRELTAEL